MRKLKIVLLFIAINLLFGNIAYSKEQETPSIWSSSKYDLFSSEFDLKLALQQLAREIRDSKEFKPFRSEVTDIITYKALGLGSNQNAPIYKDIVLKLTELRDQELRPLGDISVAYKVYLQDKIKSWLRVKTLEDANKLLSSQTKEILTKNMLYGALATVYIPDENLRAKLVDDFLYKYLLTERNQEVILKSSPSIQADNITGVIKSKDILPFLEEMLIKYDLLLSGIEVNQIYKKQGGHDFGVVMHQDNKRYLIKRLPEESLISDLLTSEILRQVGITAAYDDIAQMILKVEYMPRIKRLYLKSEFLEGFKGYVTESVSDRKPIYEYYKNVPGAFLQTAAALILGCRDIHLMNQGYIVNSAGIKQAAIVDFDHTNYFALTESFSKEIGSFSVSRYLKEGTGDVTVSQMLTLLDNPVLKFDTEMFVCEEFSNALGDIIKIFETSKSNIVERIQRQAESFKAILDESSIKRFQERIGTTPNIDNFPNDYINKIYTDRLNQAKDLKKQVDIQRILKGEVELREISINTEEILTIRKWLQTEYDVEAQVTPCQAISAFLPQLNRSSLLEVVFTTTPQAKPKIVNRENLKRALAKIIIEEGKLKSCPKQYQKEIKHIYFNAKKEGYYDILLNSQDDTEKRIDFLYKNFMKSDILEQSLDSSLR